MKNIKFVAICGAAGFVLSLIFGFFSKSGIGRILLIALIFGLVFAALAFGISFVYDKFLALDSPGQEGVVNTESASAGGEKKVLGQHIDLIVQEEPLEQSGNSNHYDVGENHQMLNDSDYNNSKKAQGDTAENTKGEEEVVAKDEFVPIRNFETVTNFSGNESSTPVEAEKRREVIQEQEAKKGDDLDVLPDMSDFKVASDNNNEDDTIVMSDSDEASFVSSATNYKSSDLKDGEIKDASLMAKAISSILAEET